MKKNLISTLALALGLFASPFGASAQSPCKGILTVNEISNGPNGNKEFVELVAATCGSCDGSHVDISNWIIDDNNGIFSSNPVVATANVGISAGHLRLTTDSLWTNFSNGTILVLFNAQDFDSTNTDFLSAAASQRFFLSSNGSVFVAVGTSTLVERKNNTPIVGATDSPDYCNATAYGFASNAWGTIGLRNDSLGDGIQVRCPGCNPSEPVFYHGISYGDAMMHVSNPSYLDGAHVTLSATDTVPGGIKSAGGRAFHFFQGSDPGLDANWQAISWDLASPGSSNSLDNDNFINAIIARTHTFNCCSTPTVVTPPADTTIGKGVLIVTEISNGPTGNVEYAELLVASCDGAADSVDIRQWVIDDNGGNFNNSRTCVSGVGISAGHLKLANNNCWKKVPVGSIIVLYNNGDNQYNFVDDGCDNNADGVYYIAVGTNTNILSNTNGSPSSSGCSYCPSTYATATSWNNIVALNNTADAFQVRCPGCTVASPNLEPAFYHGIGYGSGFSGFAAGTSDLGGAYVSGTGTGKKLVFFQGTNPGLNANWQSSAAGAVGTPPATAGNVFTAFRDSVISGAYTFPCCEGTSVDGRKAKASPAVIGQISETASESSVVLFPNPATDVVNITLERVNPFEITIVDMMNNVVYKKAYTSTEGSANLQINVASLPSGIYIYKIAASGDEQSVSGKLMIRKTN